MTLSSHISNWKQMVRNTKPFCQSKKLHMKWGLVDLSNSGERGCDFTVATSSKVADRKTTDVEQMWIMIIYKILHRALIKK